MRAVWGNSCMGSGRALRPPLAPACLAHPASPRPARPCQVSAMVSLVEAYQAGAVRDFERILRRQGPAIMGDPFIAQYMADLLANVRTQVGGSPAWGW